MNRFKVKPIEEYKEYWMVKNRLDEIESSLEYKFCLLITDLIDERISENEASK